MENDLVRKRRPVVSATEFVDAYGKVVTQKGTYQDVANALGIKVNEVVSRASKLRNLGVNLSELASAPRKRLDPTALNDRYQQIVNGAVNS